ncbi:MAG: hypothetical protein ACR2RL_18770, partial [Gammaproteobacteria bacterium]
DPFYALAHELYHTWQIVAPADAPRIHRREFPVSALSLKDRMEAFAIRYVNQMRADALGYIRTTYGIFQIDTIQ